MRGVVSLGGQHSCACRDQHCPWGVPTAAHVPRVLHRMASWSGDILEDIPNGLPPRPPPSQRELWGGHTARGGKMWPDDNGDKVPTRDSTTSPKAPNCCSPPRPPTSLPSPRLAAASRSADISGSVLGIHAIWRLNISRATGGVANAGRVSGFSRVWDARRERLISWGCWRC